MSDERRRVSGGRGGIRTPDPLLARIRRTKKLHEFFDEALEKGVVDPEFLVHQRTLFEGGLAILVGGLVVLSKTRRGECDRPTRMTFPSPGAHWRDRGPADLPACRPTA